MSELPINSGVDEPHLHPRHTGHRGLDLVLALCAIAISVISLFVAVEHGRTERDLVAASTWPRLVFLDNRSGNGTIGRGTVEYAIKNAGVGPANLVSVRVFVDGKEVHDLRELLKRCCELSVGSIAEAGRSGLSASSDMSGVLDPRDVSTLLSWNEEGAPPEFWKRLVGLGRRLSFDVCYCSALDQCWRSAVRKPQQPRPVGSCDPDVKGYGLQDD